MRIGSVKTPHAVEHLAAGARDAARAKVAGKTGQELFAIGGAVFTLLFELHQVSADQPVAQNKGLVDGGGSPTRAVRVELRDRLDERLIVHEATFFAAQRAAAALRSRYSRCLPLRHHA